jgi:hypothetical protein
VITLDKKVALSEAITKLLKDVGMVLLLLSCQEITSDQIQTKKRREKTKLHGLSPRANDTRLQIKECKQSAHPPI